MRIFLQKGVSVVFFAVLFLSVFPVPENAPAGTATYSVPPVVIPVIIRKNRFETTVDHAPRGTPLLFRVTNQGSSLEEFESYDMSFEVIVHPHQTIEIPISGLGAGTYEYFGDFHPRTAHGTLIVQ